MPGLSRVEDFQSWGPADLGGARAVEEHMRETPSGATVTVVVPHYGAASSSLPLLRTLLAQVGAPPLHVVLVDDASPEAFPGLDGVRVVRRAVNGGFGSAVNTGARLADGDLLLVLNSDLEIDEHFVRDLVARARPWLPAAVSPRVVDDHGTEAWTGRRFPRVHHQVIEWLVPLSRWRERPWWHRAVGHDLTARGTDTVVDWAVGCGAARATRRLP